MISTEKVSPSTALTVSETPSSATEPLGAMKRASSCGARKRKARHVGHVLARNDGGEPVDMAGDQMAAEFVAQFERALQIDARTVPPAADVVTASVSAAASAANQMRPSSSPVSTTVRQTPEQATEAPSISSARG